MNARFALVLALRSLARGGQRTLLAASCVAFGVMSLVALELLSSMIVSSIVVDPRSFLGGDAAVDPAGGRMTASDVAALDDLRERGVIATYSLVSESGGAMLKLPGSGRVHVVSRIAGVDPRAYPLVDAVRLRGGGWFGEAIAQPMHAVVTRDLADALNLGTGDRFAIGGGTDGPPASLIVAAVAEMNPERQGESIYYSLETASRIAGRDDVATSARVLWNGPPRPAADLAREGWTIRMPDEISEERARILEIFGLMLKGSGILGLLLGGIGVSNTMQVLLARRTLEIATLKSIGYERRHLVMLFGIEAGLLGLAGASVGAAAGVGLSAWLREMLGRAAPFMLEQAFDPGIVAGGVLVGAATAVIFGLHAIARASAVRPSTLLRELPTPPRWLETIGLALVLGLLFAAIASAVLGSVIKGMGVVAAGFGGLAILAVGLGMVFLSILAIPVRLPGLLSIARNNLRRQPGRVAVALVALFCGVFTIGFSGAMLTTAQEQFSRRALPTDGVNIAVLTSVASAGDAERSLERHNVDRVETVVTAPVSSPDERVRRVSGCRPGELSSLHVIEGSWDAGSGSALAPSRGRAGRFSIGDRIRISGPSGESAEVSVTGIYEPKLTSQLAPRPEGLVIDRSTAERLGGRGAQIQFAGHVEGDSLVTASEQIGRDLPAAMVLDRAALNDAIQGILRGLFSFVIAVAGLALVAGGVLIANSAGLAMLERRRELGIFKAIGYSSARVLAGIAAEYAMLGLVAGMAGVAGVAIALAVINRLQHAMTIGLQPRIAIAMVLTVIGIALVSALAVAWRPSRARPLDVLRQE